MDLFNILNEALTGCTYLVGQGLTVADIALAAACDDLFRMTLDENFRKNIPNVIKWFEKVNSNKSYEKYFGRVTYCQKGWAPPKSSGLKVFGPLGNIRVNMVCIACEITGLPYEFKNTPWMEVKSEEFKKKNPLQKVPCI